MEQRSGLVEGTREDLNHAGEKALESWQRAERCWVFSELCLASPVDCSPLTWLFSVLTEQGSADRVLFGRDADHFRPERMMVYDPARHEPIWILT